MDKRGASHTDWAISMAIFIMYILLMIIFLKPGVAPIYKPEGLMQLVEDNFFEETSWVVRETWLDIKECRAIVDGSTKNCLIEVSDKDSNWKFNTIKVDSDFDPRLTSSEGITGGIGSVNCFTELDGALASFSDRLMRLVYYLDLNKPGVTHDEDLKVTTNRNDDKCIVTKIGASIESEGLNEGLVNDLEAKSKSPTEKIYFTTTENDSTTENDGWGFPDNKGFKIEIYEFDINQNKETDPSVKIIPLGEPSEDANVFVKEIKTVYLNEDNSRDQILVHIEVW